MTRDVILLYAGPAVGIQHDPGLILQDGDMLLITQLGIIQSCRMNPIITLGDNGDDILEACGGLENVDMVFDHSWKMGTLASIKVALNATQGPALILDRGKLYSAETIKKWASFYSAHDVDIWTEPDRQFPWLVTLNGSTKISTTSSEELCNGPSLIFSEISWQPMVESRP